MSLLLTQGVGVARAHEPRKFAEERCEGGRFNSGAEASQCSGAFPGSAASPVIAAYIAKLALTDK